MDNLSSSEKRNSTKRVLTKALLMMIPFWAVYLYYMDLNYHWISKHKQIPGDWFSFGGVRFAFREIFVYFNAFLAYFVFRKNWGVSYTKQFWLFLIVIDLFCFVIGGIRVIWESIFLHNIYNLAIHVITTPLYFIFFTAYFLYFRDDTQKSEPA